MERRRVYDPVAMKEQVQIQAARPPAFFPPTTTPEPGFRPLQKPQQRLRTHGTFDANNAVDIPRLAHRPDRLRAIKRGLKQLANTRVSTQKGHRPPTDS